jgi:hypothetical protein
MIQVRLERADLLLAGGRARLDTGDPGSARAMAGEAVEIYARITAERGRSPMLDDRIGAALGLLDEAG